MGPCILRHSRILISAHIQQNIPFTHGTRATAHSRCSLSATVVCVCCCRLLLVCRAIVHSSSFRIGSGVADYSDHFQFVALGLRAFRSCCMDGREWGRISFRPVSIQWKLLFLFCLDAVTLSRAHTHSHSPARLRVAFCMCVCFQLELHCTLRLCS